MDFGYDDSKGSGCQWIIGNEQEIECKGIKHCESITIVPT